MSLENLGYFFMILVVFCLCGCLFYSAKTITELNSRIDFLQKSIDYNQEQIEKYSSKVDHLQNSVEDCEVREQSIIDNVLNSW